jgi:FkbM family methyltransferase
LSMKVETGLKRTGAIKYKGQFGQDEWINRFVFPGKSGGYFVDLGAGNGVNGSNTIALERDFGWQGICIEPNSYFDELKRNRSCIVDNACVTDSISRASFAECGKRGSSSYIVGLGSTNKTIQRVKIKQTEPLAAVLKRHQAPQRIEYLSLDTEGSEYIILKDFPFDTYRFLAITIEHDKEEKVIQLQRNLLQRSGYQVFHTFDNKLVKEYWDIRLQQFYLWRENRQLAKELKRSKSRSGLIMQLLSSMRLRR